MSTKKSEKAPEQSSEVLSFQEFRKLDTNERILRAAEHNMKVYGSLEPPAQVLVLSMKKKCPKCPRVGGVELFGTRANGTRLQSYCKHCRNEPGMRTGPSTRDVPPMIFTRAMRRAMSEKQREMYMKIYADVFAKLPADEQAKAKRGRW